MGISKTQIFSSPQNRLASQFKALAHPARIAILQYLSKQQACICNDIVEEIGLAQPTISQHLKELKQVGLIQGTVEGKKICYCIDLQAWKELQREFHAFFETGGSSCC
ncbi:metalloregulator ArsR/SmtB family transcription factor [Zeaxanthinibacter sp. PT1]|uniref:ArsR/SmtB family transcription factor n=1 Tax=Zeaxanthinibacter TaxID=561554 RepID=UPI00234B2ED6|nr:metalloregulator ArsR/SmtB family transcription factor [Zeaxanthinibacter sp. PT1]MDC6350321.1 metalloregulator ArsR/SmtB family transcription factor [Zeaxanthinibacter sp. PT1]